uniref:SWIM-type domain-containing protein n=1 Tax=Triticum urartu TaxID=4572 RepID=A0A8R7NZF4_TRIUA
MDNAAYSWTRHGYDLAMEELKKQCEPDWVWLSKIPVHNWARCAMDTNCKTDLICNNLSETFNRYILDVRSKPIATMLVGIYDKLMVRFDGKREGAAKARWDITPYYTERLELMKTYSRNCIPKRADLGLWQVKSGDATHEVNLATRSCSCRKWDMTALPCNHAVSAIYKAELHPEDFVSDFFKKPMYLNSYKPVFAPMPQQHGWIKTDTEDIMPPGFKDHQKGRKQEKTRKGKFEVPKPKENSRMATITCSNCKLQGHKYTSCSVPFRSDLAIRKNNHKASRSMPAPVPPPSSSSSATAPAPRPPPAAPRNPTTAFAAPRTPFAAPRHTGFRSYFSAGANACVGRDANVPPIPGISSAGPSCSDVQ